MRSRCCFDKSRAGWLMEWRKGGETEAEDCPMVREWLSVKAEWGGKGGSRKAGRGTKGLIPSFTKILTLRERRNYGI